MVVYVDGQHGGLRAAVAARLVPSRTSRVRGRMVHVTHLPRTDGRAGRPDRQQHARQRDLVSSQSRLKRVLKKCLAGKKAYLSG